MLVCAPTGAGKTVVGEFAVHLALAAGRKCFYTTPIKALSNQKHTDLVRRYGPERIGLLTGDQSINGDAPVVVMTTEVLRNMLYADSSTLHGLSYVVMDEVHFLADRMRGAVWEEVILHLPEEVRLVSLSATVSNAEEFGGWIQTVRGDTTVVVDEHRPVPLWQHVMVGKRLFDLFDYRSGDATKHGRELLVDPQLLRHIAHRREADRLADWRPRGRGGHRGRPSIYRTPARPDVVEMLDHEALLPAITFIFSRAGCDAAVKQCLRSSLRLTTDDERARIAEVIDRRCADLADSDLVVLDYHEWREGLLRGLAAHHAGMLPVFRHTVEELFTDGLVKAVFATETLALGINMPARTVVLERLVKFNGEQHVPLTPGEYTQLTGRAGRRGIDVEGHAVVLWTPDVEPAEVAGLASTRTFPLRSSFAPSYNMTINLVNQMGPTQAHKLLERSFAQYQADRSVAGLVRGIDRGERMLDEIAAELGGRDAPDPRVRAAARGDLRTGEGAVAGVAAATPQGRPTTRWRRCAAATSSTSPTGAAAGLAVVLEPARDSDDPRPLVLTENRWAGRISSADYSGASAKVGSMTLPKRVEHRQPRVRRDVASALRSAAAGLDVPRTKGKRSGRPQDPDVDPELAGSARAAASRIRAHGLADREEQGPRSPSDTCASNATTRRFSRRSSRRPTRWRERSTGSSVLLTERGFIERHDGDPGSPMTAACWPGSTAKATSWWPSAFAAASGRGWTPAELAACCRRCCTNPAATRQAHTTAPIFLPPSCVARWPTRAVLGPSCGPTSSGTASHKPRARRGLRHGYLSLGHHRRPGRGARRVRRRPGARDAAVRRAISCAGAARSSTCSTRSAMPRPTPALRAAAKRAINDIRRGVVAVDAG